MNKDNYLKYYLDFPVETSIGVSPHCVRLLDWEEYIPIAGKYLTICNDLLRRRLKLGEEWQLLDYVILMAVNEPKGIEELEKMFSFAFRMPARTFIRKKQGEIDIHSTMIVVGDYKVEDGEIVAKHIINRDNYEEIRTIMMEQAFLFDPLIGADERSQKAIDKQIKKMINKNKRKGGEANTESMLILNSSRFQINLETYTYYQLRTQYETLNREQTAMIYNICRPHGKDIPFVNFAEQLPVHENPFSYEKMFRQDNGQIGD